MSKDKLDDFRDEPVVELGIAPQVSEESNQTDSSIINPTNQTNQPNTKEN